MLEVRERTLGPQHSNTLRAKANLADAACLLQITLPMGIFLLVRIVTECGTGSCRVGGGGGWPA